MILESPFVGNIKENIHYARMSLRDSLLRGEAPIASHLFYTHIKLKSFSDLNIHINKETLDYWKKYH